MSNSIYMIINKVVIPAAGLGSRLLKLSLTQPKELLPIVDKPAIDFAIDEAIEAGFTQACIVTSEDKKPLLNKHLFEKNIDITYLIQRHPLGLGHAIHVAKEWVSGEGFGVILPDDLYDSAALLTQMVNYTEIHQRSSLATFAILPKQARNYGVASLELANEVYNVTKLLEKPTDESPDYKNAVMGRYVLTDEIWEYLNINKVGINGEIQLTDALNDLANQNNMSAFIAMEKRIDIGSPRGWLEANIYFGCKEYGKKFINDITDSINT